MGSKQLILIRHTIVKSARLHIVRQHVIRVRSTLDPYEILSLRISIT